MNTVTEYHEQAMSFIDHAFEAKRRGDEQEAKKLMRKAFELEKHAADLLKDDINAEPSRSILYRSAASLAWECGETREAEQLVAIGLNGNPPIEIANELRELYEQMNVGAA